MKLYYCEHDLFPATHNFKDEVDGAEPTGWVSNNGADCTTTIIASLNGHRKVLQLYDPNGATKCEIALDFGDPLADDVHEFWIAKSSIAANTEVRVNFYEGATRLFFIRSDTDDLQYWDGAFQTIKLNYVVANTFIHIKIVPTDATNTMDIYVDGIKEVTGGSYENNSTVGIEKITINTINATVSTTYIDAWGTPTRDTDYNIGDNLQVDWHDPYNKERITDIDTYPIITPRLNTYCQCNAVLGDFEGAKFDDWYARDFNKILIEDDSDNIIFRGFLIKKIFTKKDLTLYFAGIGALLDWKHFGAQGTINYILAEGLVDVPIPATDILTVKDNDGNPMGWDPIWWVEGARDVGILIVDKTDVNTRTWDSSAISQVGGTEVGGNNASTLTFNDTDYYNVKEGTITPEKPITIITPVIDGIAVDDTDFLKSIQIEYSFRMKIHASFLSGRNWGRVYFEILKDTKWEPIAQVSAVRYLGSHTTAWVMGIPIDVEGGNGNEKLIEDTKTELEKYFNKTGATYTSLKGMRFRTTGDLKGTSYINVHVDFINVLVGYTSDDISPIMETITDNAASTVTCDDVSAWDEMGVVENDGFKIGQNIRTVVKDIASQSGLEIDRIDNYGNTSDSGQRDPIGDGGTNEWVPVGGAGDHYTRLIDSVDATLLSTSANNKIEEFTFTEVNILGGYVTQIQVKARCYRTAHEGQKLSFCYSVDGGASWSDPQDTSSNITTTKAWHTLTFSTLEEYDLSDFQIKMYNSVFIMGGTVYCTELYVEFTISGSSFSKYMARDFKGNYCMEPLRAVCKLEGAHWYEDYINDKIALVKPADLVDSAVDLTEADYDGPWEYEDDCNQVKSFYVFGKAEDSIFAKAVDETVRGYISKHLIDESITNVADAQEIANTQLALLNTKRPLIRLPLKVDNVALQLGTTVDVTLARPTVAKATYAIRKLERARKGIDKIRLTIWVGLGESTELENVAKFIRDNMFRSHKGLTDRLISP